MSKFLRYLTKPLLEDVQLAPDSVRARTAVMRPQKKDVRLEWFRFTVHSGTRIIYTHDAAHDVPIQFRLERYEWKMIRAHKDVIPRSVTAREAKILNKLWDRGPCVLHAT